MSRSPGPLTAFLIAGSVIGLLSVALFGVIHAAIIVPIWTRLSGGIPFCLAAGLAMGWARYELRVAGRLRIGAAGGITFGFLLWATLFPMTLFGLIVRATGIHGTDDAWEVIIEFLLALSTGITCGRLISGRWRSALALGVTSLALAMAQAGPIPLMNSTRSAALFAGLAVIYIISGLALEFVESIISTAWFSNSNSKLEIRNSKVEHEI